MDISTRFQTRARAGSLFDEEGKFSPGAEQVRRKFSRTTTDPDLAASDDTTFRKPSMPASASRTTANLEHRPSLNQHQRRQSALHRENVRVPSGPREFPSPAKQRIASNTSVTTSIGDSTNTARSFLPQSNGEPFFYDPRMAASLTQLNFNNPSGTLQRDSSDASPITTPLTERGNSFLPDLNFDDLQTGIRDTNFKNYGANGGPSVSGFDAWLADTKITDNAGDMGKIALFDRGDARQQVQRQDVGRTPSLRQRLATGKQGHGVQQSVGARDVTSTQARDDSWRTRRQSSISQPMNAQALAPAGPTTKQPRKSVGPGFVTSMTKGGAAPSNAAMSTLSDAQVRSTPGRNPSVNKGARRTSVLPAASLGAELPRVSTLTATTQSRQNKVKSLQPPPRDQLDASGSPSSIKSSSKSQSNRSNTPSSSGNKRQSMAQNRAPSGLGARTISPTDARRLKRMSMMHPPPMPAMVHPKATPTPQEEVANLSTTEHPRLPELPRLAQPSPSMIPRRTSNRTPSSARASPDGRPGGVGLSSKSSFSSLINVSTNGASSRLPTPKVKPANQSGSALGQYRDQLGDGQERYNGYSGGEELVPPVPAIPKAYESPKDLEHEPPFFSSFMSSQYRTSESSFAERQLDGVSVPTPWASQTPRSSLDIPTETPRKLSGDYKRANTSTTVPQSTAPKTIRQQPDPNGRKNANLQPLRLPPLNLMPIGTRTSQNGTVPALPRPSQEVDSRADFDHLHTPEPKRTAKTPSTPMTASKATFFRRQDDANKALRGSTSHYALRDVMGMDSDGNMLTKYWDDSDLESAGVPISSTNGSKPRNAITPFSSGSLPKGSGEYARMRARPSGEHMDDEYDLLQLQQSSKTAGVRARPQRGATVTSLKSSLGAETPMSLESPVAEAPAQPEVKKDGERKGEGMRRKLSINWRRSSSKSANHVDNKSSPPQETNGSAERERRVLHKQPPPDMPPPKLPAGANNPWSGEVSASVSGARPSFDSVGKRKSQVPTSVSTTSLVSGVESDSTTGTGGKTRSQHMEQPTPVNAPATTRASSWGTLGSAFRSNSKMAPVTRHRLTPSTISAVNKDKDDLAADDEMARLSRKRKDVDSAARESEELKKRALARSPVSAEHVLHDRSLLGGASLNVFERGEVIDYESDGIYFTGTKSARKIIGSLNNSPPLPAPSATSDKTPATSTNFGYDDERGDYNIVMGDHLAYRYEVVDVLGKGSFGQVVRCVDHKEGGIVAVKIIRNKKRFHQQALVEVGILGKLREWDPEGAHATLSITSSFYFRSHLCIVTPCLSINLYELIRAHNFTGFSMPLIRRFARQLLACLTLLQTKRIIHCDLKPENILLFEARKADVRVIDFGSSCREEEKVYTYIQSRFYRSPEVILGSSYGLGIDMWSFGCILAELWTGYPIFPGENEQEQLACIMEIFGPPDRHLVERCTRKKLFFDSVGKPRVTVSSKGKRRRPSSKTLQQALKTEDEAFVDFITRCLRWDPDRRLKPSEAVTHPFITNLPFSQRPGIPEDARRAARVRSTAAVPTTNGQTVPSPVKRTSANAGNAVAPPQPLATPARDRSRVLPDTPQTAVRSGAQAVPATTMMHGSPVKTAANANRRHSTVTTAGATAMMGSKRASNGVVLGTATASNTAVPQSSRSAGVGNLAQIAARESMGIAGNAAQSSASKWRS